jgi:hypothetical protein
MMSALEFPFPPAHEPPAGGRLEPPFVPVELRWEYREIVGEGPSLPSEAELNALGGAGWELVGVAPAGGRCHFYFKRERR